MLIKYNVVWFVCGGILKYILRCLNIASCNARKVIGLSDSLLLIFDEWQSKQIKPCHANIDYAITESHRICPIHCCAAGHNLPWNDPLVCGINSQHCVLNCQVSELGSATACETVQLTTVYLVHLTSANLLQ